MIRFEPAPSRKVLWPQFLWFLAWVAVTVIGVILSPSPHGHGTHQQLGLPPCPAVLIAGRPCPGCGLTTSFTATLQGSFSEAFSANPFGPFMYAIFTITAFMGLYGFVKKLQMDTDTKAFNLTMTWFFSAFLVFGVIRFALVRAVPFPEKRILSRVQKQESPRLLARKSGDSVESLAFTYRARL